MEPSSVKRRLTCILAADAVGYSKQMGQDEEGTIHVLQAHRSVIDGIVAFHHGRIVSTAGGSVLAEFSSAVVVRRRPLFPPRLLPLLCPFQVRCPRAPWMSNPSSDKQILSLPKRTHACVCP